MKAAGMPRHDTAEHARKRGKGSSLGPGEVAVVGRRVRGDRSIRPLAHDEQRVVLADEDQRPLPRRCLVRERHHLSDVREVAPKLRIEAGPHEGSSISVSHEPRYVVTTADRGYQPAAWPALALAKHERAAFVATFERTIPGLELAPHERRVRGLSTTDDRKLGVHCLGCGAGGGAVANPPHPGGGGPEGRYATAAARVRDRTAVLHVLDRHRAGS